MLEVSGCRLCSADLVPVLDLGVQPLSSVFPMPGASVPETPLELMKCEGCRLVQLRHNCPLEVWGGGYGYRSGLNASMIEHLRGIAENATTVAGLEPGDMVLDIGSNDGTLLGYYGEVLERIGFDPTARKFGKHYAEGVVAVSEFFTAEAFQKVTSKQAKVVTTIACFYDLAEPLKMVNDICEILADDGIWIAEQSYLPAMVRARSFDTICHEHLEYYTLLDFELICRLAGLEIFDVSFNNTNGGSFIVSISRQNAGYSGDGGLVKRTLQLERKWRLVGELERFAEWVPGFRDRLRGFFYIWKGVLQGYGASTKGNILLNYCDITTELIPRIADVNPDKWGKVTPGSNIPIVSEDAARQFWDPKLEKTYFVLPWHFKKGIVEREKEFLASGGVLWFPLPEHEFVI